MKQHLTNLILIAGMAAGALLGNINTNWWTGFLSGGSCLAFIAYTIGKAQAAKSAAIIDKRMRDRYDEYVELLDESELLGGDTNNTK